MEGSEEFVKFSKLANYVEVGKIEMNILESIPNYLGNFFLRSNLVCEVWMALLKRLAMVGGVVLPLSELSRRLTLLMNTREALLFIVAALDLPHASATPLFFHIVEVPFLLKW